MNKDNQPIFGTKKFLILLQQGNHLALNLESICLAS